MNAHEPAAAVQPYRTLRVTKTDEGVLSVVIDAPLMNLIGPELVRDLVGLLGEVESGQHARVMVLESAVWRALPDDCHARPQRDLGRHRPGPRGLIGADLRGRIPRRMARAGGLS